MPNAYTRYGILALAGWLIAASALAESAPEDTKSNQSSNHRFSAVLESEAAYGMARDRANKMEMLLEPQWEYRWSEDTRITGIARLYTEGFDHLEPGRLSQGEVSPNSRRLQLGDRTDVFSSKTT
jgi:hypothetical protein